MVTICTAAVISKYLHILPHQSRNGRDYLTVSFLSAGEREREREREKWKD